MVLAPLATLGPFHRGHTSNKQPDSLALQQQRERRVCGRAFNWGGAPCVKAYNGLLPNSEHGIEFWTDTAPSEANHPTVTYWREGTAGVISHPDDKVCIEVVVTKVILKAVP